ncbi:co-chaperone DjlA [Pseudochryseolinea flava]|uniref:TerB family tellurite resistance protein n=1 Tax=Pseudochryseolinea flava TaxID=2059302 RepID=A0A364Y7M1_9BACT|nr:hypothetical protein [Pseudochryseolinea flava]RAW03071.1 hypothetical protein DQQ10_02945 [Pseudochryseolinea flava]
MRPHDKGWLKEYLEFRKDLLQELTTEEGHKGSHPEQSLYRVIQPTGLMYGQSVGDITLPEHEKWSEKDRMKILLAESLISSSLLFYDKPIRDVDELSNVFSKTLESIGNFYNNIFPELATPAKTLFGKKKSPMEVAEIILNKRIEHTSSYEGNFWTYFFHNTLLFLDVFIFGQWIHTNADKIVADFFRYEREELRFSVVKVIASAAHANKVIAFEEKKLFDYFLQSTDFSGERRKEAQRIFEEGITVEEINLPSENSWILKKFFLEIAILTLWADKKVEQSELDYLKAFCGYLGFTEEDLENSMLAIEGFILEHWVQLEHLQNKQDYHQVSNDFIARVSKITERNKSRLVKAMQGDSEMIELMRKARANELSNEERETMREKLIVILKTIPTFVIIALPQKFLTLPILLKILPKNLFADGVPD